MTLETPPSSRLQPMAAFARPPGLLRTPTAEATVRMTWVSRGLRIAHIEERRSRIPCEIHGVPALVGEIHSLFTAQIGVDARNMQERAATALPSQDKDRPIPSANANGSAAVGEGGLGMTRNRAKLVSC